ncbi:MAG: FMN-binding negative transcriptional regulator [Flavobacteriales bacterium]
MYIPRHFRQDNQQILTNFINHIGFGILVQSTDSLPLSTHIPVYVHHEQALQIRTHMALHNPHAKAIVDGGKALLIIQGEHAYISPSTYEQVDVPTWDYRIVHCEVQFKIPTAEEAKSDLFDLVRFFEKSNPQPIQPETFPDGMMQDYLKFVFPFRMNILSMQGAWKLSQNRTEYEKEQIRKMLERQGNSLWRLV